MENEDTLNDETTSAAGAGFTTQAAMAADVVEVETIEEVSSEENELDIAEDSLAADIEDASADDEARGDLDVVRIEEILGSDTVNLGEPVNEGLAAEILAFATTPLALENEESVAIAADAPPPTQEDQVLAIAEVDDGGAPADVPIDEDVEDEGPVQTDGVPTDGLDGALVDLPTDVAGVEAQSGVADGADTETPAEMDPADCPADMAAAAPVDDLAADTPADDASATATDSVDAVDTAADEAVEPTAAPDVDEAATTDIVETDGADIDVPQADTVDTSTDTTVDEILEMMADMAVDLAAMTGDMDDCV